MAQNQAAPAANATTAAKAPAPKAVENDKAALAAPKKGEKLPGEERQPSDNVQRALKKVGKADDMVSHAKRKLEDAQTFKEKKEAVEELKTAREVRTDAEKTYEEKDAAEQTF